MPQTRLELLRRIAVSAGELATHHLSGIEKGAVLSLSLAVDALLFAEADVLVFLALREKFAGLPTPSAELEILYGALLGVCDLAVRYDEKVAESLCASLLSLSDDSSSQWN